VVQNGLVLPGHLQQSDPPPSLYPFKDFFLKRLENRKRWEVEQKIFSLIGFVAVIGADILVLSTWVFGK
jgi:hypothetical protein